MKLQFKLFNQDMDNELNEFLKNDLVDYISHTLSSDGSSLMLKYRIWDSIEDKKRWNKIMALMSMCQKDSEV
ncbi:hypothetical protein RD055328_08580 [Companilactobacillus sp. RD055328]|uniref:hypothetical protein n=1 Tax=Companilactobacillus sp. RD055328 TaxID=2916634 RepID=UPI001FC88439|nr:hypothetical protein [Companilactobacillus sp. RD055328]GKQ42935.1 hypothetical protein RD055328_08580 [Companilactobacillus sp. RD055328]